MKRQLSAGIVVYYENNQSTEYLLLQYGAGHWDFAKGKLEQGETKIQAALRELQEETGLTTIDIKKGFESSLTYTFQDFRGNPVEKTVHFFIGQVPTKEKITLSHEHKDYTWLPFEPALEQLTYQNAKDVLTKAHEFLK
ncbi:MAG: bis(5'-nucleosyl)-tetraphosphatase [Candidatus Dependentiae bacterium]|nr:bis(5'-nucleosyl)-tetraphosphatase [Candidatus Dependentiae bacterium]